MAKTVAKFKVSYLRSTDCGAGALYNMVRLDAQYDQNLPEDQRFAKATPSAHAELVIDNPAAMALFKPGKTCMVTFEFEDEPAPVLDTTESDELKA